MQEIDLKEMDKRIQAIKNVANELIQMGESFPALSRNTSRILASIRILEIHISDVLDAENIMD